MATWTGTFWQSHPEDSTASAARLCDPNGWRCGRRLQPGAPAQLHPCAERMSGSGGGPSRTPWRPPRVGRCGGEPCGEPRLRAGASFARMSRPCLVVVHALVTPARSSPQSSASLAWRPRRASDGDDPPSPPRGGPCDSRICCWVRRASAAGREGGSGGAAEYFLSSEVKYKMATLNLQNITCQSHSSTEEFVVS